MAGPSRPARKPARNSPVDRLLLGFLIVDGLAVGLLSVAFAYQRFGGVALPVAAVLAGVVNAVLLWLAAGFTSTPLRYGPLGAWGLVVLVAGAVPGPGGDVILTPGGDYLVQTVLLLALGVGPAVALSWTNRLPEPR
ncbi:facilitated glucose transporter [Gordonia sp. zg691]|uniref:facilitated glucose transporter n=1 Tax=Gordonia jinghuaiqii TaxID=2758710 RepID=UPI0016622432|nr:facilitated glucose transporter [Gordonia jinghuaiqii]MBD0859722.1 facilitated glucose transporter [Gordonia jinghuaiqii]